MRQILSFPYLPICLAFLMAGCDSTQLILTEDQEQPNSLPIELRAITPAAVSAEVVLNGTTTTYTSADFPDGDWIFYPDIQRGTEYDIFISWMVDGVLVMEEQGTFTVDANASIVTPVLSRQVEATDSNRFDYNCDGKSNLAAAIDNESPGTRPADPAACDSSTPTNPDSLERVWMNLNFSRLDSTFSDRVTRYSQPIRVDAINTAEAAGRGVTIYTIGGPDQKNAALDLHYSPASGKSVRLTATGLPVLPANNSTGSCQSLGPDRARCTTRFDWQEQRWYELVFEEVDLNNWNGWIVDLTTNQQTMVGTFQSAEEIIWVEPIASQAYDNQVTGRACTQGLPPISFSVRNATLNSVFAAGDPRRTQYSDCVRYGAGSRLNYTVDVNGTTTHQLTLGR